MAKTRIGLRGALIAFLAILVAGCGTSARWSHTNEALDEERAVLARSDGSAAYLPGDPDEAAAAARWWLATRQLSLTPRRWNPQQPCSAPHKREPRVLVLLALSGGGHRAAYFSALTMQALSRLPDSNGKPVDVLGEVDLISAVSGGTLPAAYYVASQDAGQNDCLAPSGRVWSPDKVAELMTHDYLKSWLGRWFLPHNIARFWTTAYDRTDIMAGVFADHMYSRGGRPISLDELNPSRPNLVINATVGSRATADEDNQFGSVFTFTHEDFASRSGSDIGRYELARAVMASSTFPGVFSFMTLRDYRTDENETRPRYIHVFDGGNSDNLGLTTIKRTLFGPNGDGRTLLEFDKVIVLQVDAFVDSTGADPRKPDPRGFWDYLFDSNVIEATDSLLEANRDRLLREFKRRTFQPYESPPDYGDDDAEPEKSRARDCRKDGMPDEICLQTEDWWTDLNQILKKKLLFVHINFQAVRDRELQKQLRSISTVGLRRAGEDGVKIDDTVAIERGVASIFDPHNCPADRNRRRQSICNCWDAVTAVLADPSVNLDSFEVNDGSGEKYNYFCPLGERTAAGQQAY